MRDGFLFSVLRNLYSLVPVLATKSLLLNT